MFRTRTTPSTVTIPGPKKLPEFHIDNVHRLIKVLEALPDEAVEMAAWVSNVSDHEPKKNECGTSACALGWAALSGEIPGLGWAPNNGRRKPQKFPSVVPVINGIAQESMFGWTAAGYTFFGDHVGRFVFSNTSASREEVIVGLRRFIETGRAY